MPIADEHPLYYYNWVEDNIKKVNDATKGQVGYLHVPERDGKEAYLGGVHGEAA